MVHQPNQVEGSWGSSRISAKAIITPLVALSRVALTNAPASAAAALAAAQSAKYGSNSRYAGVGLPPSLGQTFDACNRARPGSLRARSSCWGPLSSKAAGSVGFE